MVEGRQRCGETSSRFAEVNSALFCCREYRYLDLLFAYPVLPGFELVVQRCDFKVLKFYRF